jgi:ankyrin repeat protein
VEFIPGILGMDHVEWRCAKGKVLGCASTKWPICKALTDSEKSRAPTTDMIKYCQQYPNSFPIPVYVAGYNNVYEWHCDGSNPVKKREINLADEQGYNAALWRVVSEDVQVHPNYDLWRASTAGELPGIEQALNAGSDVNSKTRNGQTPLSVAVLSDQSAAAKYLLDHGAAQDWLSPIEGTLLAYAQSPDMVDLLVDHGVDPNKADKNGWCPLVWSVGRSSGTKDFKAVSIELIAKGAKVNCANRNGMTALHFVRDPEITKLLIDHGADVNALDNGGFTPLHQAAAKGDLEVARILISAGAKNLRGKQNQLPIDLARAPSNNDPATLAMRPQLIEMLSRLPVPAEANQSDARSQAAAAAQHEKLTVDMGSVNTVTSHDLEECVRSFTDIVVAPLGNFGPQGRCADFFPLTKIRAIDVRENGGQLEVLTELTFRILQDVKKDAIIAHSCTGSDWTQDLNRGGGVVVTKAVQFDKWSHQSICDTKSLSPIVKGASTNP